MGSGMSGLGGCSAEVAAGLPAAGGRPGPQRPRPEPADARHGRPAQRRHSPRLRRRPEQLEDTRGEGQRAQDANQNRLSPSSRQEAAGTCEPGSWAATAAGLSWRRRFSAPPSPAPGQTLLQLEVRVVRLRQIEFRHNPPAAFPESAWPSAAGRCAAARPVDPCRPSCSARGCSPPRGRRRSCSSSSRVSGTSTSGAMPSALDRAAGRRVVPRRGQPHRAVAGIGITVCTEPLPKLWVPSRTARWWSCSAPETISDAEPSRR